MATKYKRVSDGYRRRYGTFKFEPVHRFIVGDPVATYLVRVTRLSPHWTVTTSALHGLLRDAFQTFGVKWIELVSEPNPCEWGYSSDDELEGLIATEESFVEYYSDIGEFMRFAGGPRKTADFGVIWNSGNHVRYEWLTGQETIWRPFLCDPDMIPDMGNETRPRGRTLPAPAARGTPREYLSYLTEIGWSRRKLEQHRRSEADHGPDEIPF